MKNNRVDDLHAFAKSNDGASFRPTKRWRLLLREFAARKFRKGMTLSRG